MICIVSGVEIHDGDVWIVEILGGECTPTYRYILRAEIETDWVWSENGESHTVIPTGVTWWAFGSDVAQSRPEYGDRVLPYQCLYRHEEGKPKCL